MEATPSTMANTSTCMGVSAPVANGRSAVRAITLSMR